MSAWTITDLTPAAPAALERLTAKQDLLNGLRDWQQRHGFPVDGAIFGTDDDGDLTLVLTGLTLEDGDIVPNEREYEYTATITLEVTVRGSVTARNEDDARELAFDEVNGIDWDINAYSVTVIDWTGTDAEVSEVSEE
jgi:hypothetical protein